MKKKQLTSILLAGIMALGLCIPAFADNTPNANNEGTGGQSTNVEYTALNNENYLLTVPANMTPGETGNVSLTGSWPSTRTMKVTADANVVLTNSINATDKKTLTISFNEIALAGNNNETVSATGEVSVQDITNANFGEWTGRFSYYVNGEGTGAGTGTGTDDPVVSLAPTMASGNTWYKSTQAKKTITSIKFVNSYTPTGNEDEQWFADKDNGAVPETQITAYRTGTEIIVAGNGARKIMANEDSSYMFSDTSYYKTFASLKSLDISILDTSKVTDMNNMFYNCYKLTSLNVSNFNTSNVTNMKQMFISCSALTSLNVSSFDTSKVTNMEYMFYNCEALTSLDVSNFDTSKVTNMGGMFSSCSKLTSLDVSNFNTSKVTNMNTMFSVCYGLISLDVSNFNTSNVTNMSGMFLNCNKLTSLNVSSFDTSKVIDMSDMFHNCRALTSLDLSNFNTYNVEDMEEMFYNCQALTSIYVGYGWSTNSLTTSNHMFKDCTNLPNYKAHDDNRARAHTGPGGYLTLKA